MIVTKDKQISGKCPECNSDKFHYLEGKGEVICKACGTVVDETTIDFGKDWGFTEEGESISRSGSPFDPRVANNLRTSVGNYSDISKLSGSNRTIMNRIRKKNNWSASALEANFNNALTYMRSIASFLKITDVVEKEAAQIYRTAAERGLTKCRSNDCIVVAALYIACRIHGIPKTMTEFADAAGINKKVLGKTYKLLMRTLSIKVQPNNPLDYLSRFCSALKLSPKVQSRAAELIEEAQSKELLSGLNPLSVAASTMYIASLMLKEKRTQKELSETTGITEVTLRKRVKELVKGLDINKKELAI